MWSGMEASSRSEVPMHGLSFRGHTGSFVSPFLGVGVEVKQGGGCTYALGTAEVSPQPASIAPLCAFEMDIYGWGGSSVEGTLACHTQGLGFNSQHCKGKGKKESHWAPSLQANVTLEESAGLGLVSVLPLARLPGVLSGAQSRVTHGCPVGMKALESAALCLSSDDKG